MGSTKTRPTMLHGSFCELVYPRVWVENGVWHGLLHSIQNRNSKHGPFLYLSLQLLPTCTLNYTAVEVKFVLRCWFLCFRQLEEAGLASCLNLNDFFHICNAMYKSCEMGEMKAVQDENVKTRYHFTAIVISKFP